MKITILVEGKTEKSFAPILRGFIFQQLSDKQKPKLDMLPYHGRIPKEDKLKRVVAHLLTGKNASDHVIALTDVYTGTNPPDFQNAADAKSKMISWVGDEPRFHPHVAQYDFEAWLIPYWSTIQKLASTNRTAPSGDPEKVNHNKPPAHRLKELFEVGKCRDSYVKPRDAARILADNDLMIAVQSCSELKKFVNTILTICEADEIP